MNPRDGLLAQGIAAAREGDRRRARYLLVEALRQNPDSVDGWLWLSAVLDTPQGKSFCLRRVLAVHPGHGAAQKGLAALQKSPPAPAILVSRPPDAPVDGGKRPLLAPLMGLVEQARFWPALVACLGTIAIALLGILAFSAWGGARPVRSDTVAAIAPSAASVPHSTLRPTFTPTPTWTATPLPSDTPTPTATPTASPTPTLEPTATPTLPPTALPTTRPAARAGARAPTAAPSPTTRPSRQLSPRALDARLPGLGVRIEPAFVGTGQPYWRLVEVRWADEQEAEGKHNIYVKALNAQGNRAVGQPVLVQWGSGSVVLPIEAGPPPEWGANFPMYNTLGSYTVSMGGATSDRITGLGLGTAQAPGFTIHTCFYLTFRLTYR